MASASEDVVIPGLGRSLLGHSRSTTPTVPRMQSEQPLANKRQSRSRASPGSCGKNYYNLQRTECQTMDPSSPLPNINPELRETLLRQSQRAEPGDPSYQAYLGVTTHNEIVRSPRIHELEPSAINTAPVVDLKRELSPRSIESTKRPCPPSSGQERTTARQALNPGSGITPVKCTNRAKNRDISVNSTLSIRPIWLANVGILHQRNFT